jgi:3-polyprenyl-4-hydroxybenzoate decarboxylase
VSLTCLEPGDGKAALVAALARTGVKHVVVVDDDIDITDDKQVEWAISTRYQADRDTVILTGVRTFPLDPSLPPRAPDREMVTAKLGLDATRRMDKKKDVFMIPRAPFEDDKKPAPESVPFKDDEFLPKAIEALKGGPRFVDFFRLFPTTHQSVFVRALGTLFDRKMIKRDGEGRYWLTEKT